MDVSPSVLLRTTFWRVIFLVSILVSSNWATAAERVSDIRNSKHNFSSNSGNDVRAMSEDEVCVFCHTPHGATSMAEAPLWNRALSVQSYDVYSSSSLDADPTYNTGPDGKSKLCLSCHDGTLAIGSVNVINGSEGDGNPTTDDIAMMSTNGKMPTGSGTTTGFTRNLGTDLTNDHPVSFRYDDTLATKDTELRKPSDEAHIGVAQVGVRPQFPLDANNKMQCTTCHDPHVGGIDQPTGTTLAPGVTDNIKFLRGKRFQMANPTGVSYTEATDIVCLSCHEKLGNAWNQSVHANDTDANETYKDAAADQREFPRGIKVWQAGCLNCHDTHTATGSRRLLREGTDSTSSPKQGGKPAIEQTCYQCHSNSSTSILNGTTTPDIKSQFALTYKMPLTNYVNNEEMHDIGKTADYPLSFPANGAGANFIEAPESLGAGGTLKIANRHAECTDCHNPHRIVKNERYDGTGGSGKATHKHGKYPGNTGLANLTAFEALNHNAAPGALKGTFGVEIAAWNDIPLAWSAPLAGTGQTNQSISFGSLPSTIEIRCGIDNTDCDANPPVTKEYQVCMKCHSNFAYDDNGNPDGHPSGNGRPDTMYVDSVNPLKQYTNQAMEFQAPTAHKGETNSMVDSGAHSRYETTANFNHRSWHPVMEPTGRTATIRGFNNWVAPWNTNLGNQTMMCSDCHNNGTNGKAESTSATAVGGPHGSNNRKILRSGGWTASSENATSTLCRDCHQSPAGTSGMDHATHSDKTIMRCPFCHIAIPHGWKNKSFVANLNDIGPEVLCNSNTRSNSSPQCALNQPVPKGTRWTGGATPYINPPYYMGTVVKVKTWRKARMWQEASCGNTTGSSGEGWMRETCEY